MRARARGFRDRYGRTILFKRKPPFGLKSVDARCPHGFMGEKTTTSAGSRKETGRGYRDRELETDFSISRRRRRRRGIHYNQYEVQGRNNQKGVDFRNVPKPPITLTSITQIRTTISI